ncbi:hypothetical protein GR294_01720 [Raoultella sp. Lac2]|uniref:hypothetical protein n=1 Tax=unclassified Raoultella TaxID=2627600 RepID=UPI0013542004|nr:hypothetical protein [Raoultella sp. Lac2]MXF97280.1 hypothetical protein [Raoultella sp. Lac1]
MSRLVILPLPLTLASRAGYFSPLPQETQGDDTARCGYRSRHHVIIGDRRNA